MKTFGKFRKGAASFYIVAFSTLILVIIAASFAAVIISEVTRTSNDDLSQSAYDAALAGVEDAKLAIMNYRKCKENDPNDPGTQPVDGRNATTCSEIIWLMENKGDDCDVVSWILGRQAYGDTNEVPISETTSSGGNNLQQAYTCVKIKTVLQDYRGSISATSPARVIKIDLADKSSANNINYARISWYDGENKNFNNAGKKFYSLSEKRAATPPTIAVQLVQTADTFNLEQFEQIGDGATNRGTVYLVPNGDSGEETTVVKKATIVDSNDREKTNEPILIDCNNKDGDFACSAWLELPSPIGENRNPDTFMFVVSLPYGQPDTNFSLELCTDKDTCVAGEQSGTGDDSSKGPVELNGVQVMVDSTGRANDLFRRIETRLETTDSSFPYPFYAIQLLGEKEEGKYNLEKDMTVTCEANFYKGEGTNCN